ncbi:pentatricopeptide repeat-containing protein At3g26540 [Aegilops tauschii subsp. strangulata]|nr:pentatricopeptide repeat-containing protein At3g26540 [Aegilops tauschii subsp. strangulata]XP_044332756.1 pentatricopeptide repeat-containing protein At3g26540-like [Triticum aestivum]
MAAAAAGASTSAATVSAISAQIAAGRLFAAIDNLTPSCSSSPIPSSLYASLLRLATHHGSLSAARRITTHFASSASQFNRSSVPTFLFNRAIESLAACGGLADARELFDLMPRRDGGSWNAIIYASSRAGKPTEALSLFADMYSRGVRPNDVTMASVLACCSECLNPCGAQQLHGHISKRDFQSNVILGTALVDVYGKCHLLADARQAFDGISEPNAISWNVIIRRYLLAGMGDMAAEMFFRMVRAGVRPLVYTVSHALLACRDNNALEEGRCMHTFVLRHGYEHHIHVRSSVVDMYAKCGAIDAAQRLFNVAPVKDVIMSTSILSGLASCGRIGDAKRVFDRMQERNLVSWNAMLTGYIRSSDLTGALHLFQQMRKETKELDDVTLGSVLNACTGMLDIRKGEEVHAFAFKCGLLSYPFLKNALVRMYSKCGCLRSAELLLQFEMGERDRYSWNSLISGYERHSMSEAALHALSEMQSEVTPNQSTFSSALAACANIFLLKHGMEIHAYMIRSGYEIDDILQSALIDMYCKCRLFDYGIRIFEAQPSRDVILWNSMILGCAYSGKGEYGLELFDEMQAQGIKADSVTFLGALVSCISEGHVGLGKSYFTLMTEESILPRMEHYECMIELLGKHGHMVELEDFVDHMPFEPPTTMWLRIFDCCREYGNRKLGERAAKCINDSNPQTPVRYEATADYMCSDGGSAEPMSFGNPDEELMSPL